MKTKQKMFDKVATHLMTQKYKSTTATETNCLYRDGKGGMCAIGCLIPDSIYTPDFEYRDVFSLVKARFKLKTPNIIKKFTNFASELQLIHDFHMPEKKLNLKQREKHMEVVRDALILCALENKLNITEVLLK